MRIGLFGGTFDPPHLGHLLFAERCREAANLDQIWLVPAYLPPHKNPRRVSRWEYRLTMIQLAVVGQEHFRVDEIERELLPPSYTLQTVDALEQRHPNHQFALILGGDSVRDLPNWHEPGPLVSRVEIVAGARPGAETWSAFQLAEALRVSEQTIRLQWVPIPQIELASRELRQRVQAGQSIRFAVPRPVEEFIRERQLYQQDTHESR